MQIPSYEELMRRVLDRVPDTVDKREGSLIWTAVGPVCAELAQAYTELDAALDLVFPDTGCGEYLDRAAEQSGIFRAAASAAVCRGEFWDGTGQKISIPEGMRFGADGIFYRRGKMLEKGVYELICETAGTAGNLHGAELLPVDYLENLGKAEITALLIPGIASETDEELRHRLLARAAEPAFGGNIADYREKVRKIPGVTAVKVEPVPQGGGSVGLCILGAEFLPAGDSLQKAVQQAADPEPGRGRGFAPIGHRVSVRSGRARTVAVSAKLTLAGNQKPETVQSRAEAALQAHFLQMRGEWASEKQLTVRLSRIASVLLALEHVLDVSVTLDGTAGNLLLEADEVPVLGTVTLTEG